MGHVAPDALQVVPAFLAQPLERMDYSPNILFVLKMSLAILLLRMDTV